MELLLTNEDGSLNHASDWHLFDQIILSNNWLKPHDNPLRFKTAGI